MRRTKSSSSLEKGIRLRMGKYEMTDRTAMIVKMMLQGARGQR